MTLLACLSLAAVAQTSGATSVPESRLDRLSRGINLSHWWAQAGDYGPERLRTYMTAHDYDLIAEMGFAHVRLTLNPKAIWDLETPVALMPDKVKMLQEDVDAFVSRGVAVIVDCHPDDDFKEHVFEKPGYDAAFTEWWSQLAGALKGTDPEMVFFEVMNEPVNPDTARWMTIQSRTLLAIRNQAPDHTVVVGPSRWTGVDDLLAMQPYSEGNLVYNFHFYDPSHFTHQGATWGWDKWQFMKGVPYPVTAESVATMIDTVQDPQAKAALVDLGKDTWTRTTARDRLAKVAAWAKKHNVPVTCNEFGTYKAFSPRESRLLWIKDVREELEAAGIGWTMWDYAGGFSVVEGEPRKADAGVLASLGLGS